MIPEITICFSFSLTYKGFASQEAVLKEWVVLWEYYHCRILVSGKTVDDLFREEIQRLIISEIRSRILRDVCKFGKVYSIVY